MADLANEQVFQEEYLDVLTKTGQKTGISKPRGHIHRDGDYHRAVHVWIFAESTEELLLQLRAECKDSWPGQWDISSAGHISAGDSSLVTARRELHEELDILLPKDAFELLFVFLQECVINDGKFINNEFNDVYLVTTTDPIPLEAFTLQESEVSAVKYISLEEYRSLLVKEDPQYVPYDVNDQYGQLFEILSKRYTQNAEARTLILQKKMNRYARVSLKAELTGLSNADKEALKLIIKAARIMDQIFFLQVWYSNPSLRDWLEQHADESELEKSKWLYYLVNKSPWSCLDENEAFLTTADSGVKLLHESTKAVAGWNGIEYRTAFPVVKPAGANFYPPDMDKMEFELWKNNLPEDKKKLATGFFNVIKRESERILDKSPSSSPPGSTGGAHDLYIVPYSDEYNAFLSKAADLLHKAGDLTSSSSLKKLLHSKADAFLSNEYYDSDIAWMELELQELHSALEEAKADIVGLWALRFLVNKELLPKTLIKSMYVSFLAGCFRSVRFGLEEAHGKGQALQFNYLFDKGAFVLHVDGKFSVEFDKIEEAVESLSRKILTIQAKGDKGAAKTLLLKHCVMTPPLKLALENLEKIKVPVDILPEFPIADEILNSSV